MRKLLLVSALLLALGSVASLVHAGKYSVRELGFVETGPRPYRLLLFYDDPTAIAAKLQELALQKDLLDTNITLVPISLDQRKTLPQYDKIPVPARLTQPSFWLVGPDDRFIAFDPATAKRELLQSPLRHALLHAAARALCSIVLLESTDVAANEAAQKKVETVLAQINQVQSKLVKAPTGKILLQTLPVANRAEERWTLWSLGDDVAAPAQPKVAVVFGNLRQAGAVFEGTTWDDAELFARIAALGQSCEGALDRKQFLGSALVFRAPTDWNEKLTELLTFNPKSKEVKTEIADVVARAPAEGKARRWTFDDLKPDFKVQDVTEEDPHKGERPEADPMHDPRNLQEDALPMPDPPMPGFPADLVGMVLAILGIAGWIALGATYRMLLQRSTALTPS